MSCEFLLCDPSVRADPLQTASSACDLLACVCEKAELFVLQRERERHQDSRTRVKGGGDVCNQAVMPASESPERKQNSLTDRRRNQRLSLSRRRRRLQQQSRDDDGLRQRGWVRERGGDDLLYDYDDLLPILCCLPAAVLMLLLPSSQQQQQQQRRRRGGKSPLNPLSVCTSASEAAGVTKGVREEGSPSLFHAILQRLLPSSRGVAPHSKPPGVIIVHHHHRHHPPPLHPPCHCVSLPLSLLRFD